MARTPSVVLNKLKEMRVREQHVCDQIEAMCIVPKGIAPDVSFVYPFILHSQENAADWFLHLIHRGWVVLSSKNKVKRKVALSSIIQVHVCPFCGVKL